MKTVILEQPGHFTLMSTDAPDEPRPGEALVRVHRVGICGTDLHAYRGRQPFFTYPRILGHELGVEIVEIGANKAGLQVDDRCATHLGELTERLSDAELTQAAQQQIELAAQRAHHSSFSQAGLRGNPTW